MGHTVKPRPRLAGQFLWGLIAFTTVLWATRPATVWLAFSHDKTLIVGLIIVVLSEIWPIEMGHGRVTLSSVGYLSVFIIAGPVAALWILTVGTVLSWPVRGYRGLTSVANLALMSLTLLVAVAGYRWMGRDHVLGALVFAASYIVINHAIVNGYFWVRDGRLPREEMVPSLAWDSLGWLVTLPMVAIYVLLEHAYHRWWAAALGLLSYVILTLLLTVYHQMRAAHSASRQTVAATHSIASAQNQSELAEWLRDALSAVAGFTTFVLYLADPGPGHLMRTLVVHPDGDDRYPLQLDVPSEGLVAWSLATHTPEMIADARKVPHVIGSGDDSQPVVSGLILPLSVNRETYGVAVLGREYPNAYRKTQFDGAVLLAQHGALAYRKWMLQEEALQLSRVDPLLPGVYNFRYFREVLEWRTRHSAGRPMALAFCDLDGFKAVNDRYGHSHGDAILQRFSVMVQADLRANDVLARYGGDEFVVLFDNVDEKGAVTAVTRLQMRGDTEAWHDLDCVVGVSVGFALYPEDGETAERLLNVADMRMYTNKVSRKSDARTVPYV